MEETQGVVGSAETGSPSRGTLASLREASTSPVCNGVNVHKYVMLYHNAYMYKYIREYVAIRTRG